jgi:hypothetical protein
MPHFVHEMYERVSWMRGCNGIQAGCVNNLSHGDVEQANFRTAIETQSMQVADAFGDVNPPVAEPVAFLKREVEAGPHAYVR